MRINDGGFAADQQPKLCVRRKKAHIFPSRHCCCHAIFEVRTHDHCMIRTCYQLGYTVIVCLSMLH